MSLPTCAELTGMAPRDIAATVYNDLCRQYGERPLDGECMAVAWLARTAIRAAHSDDAVRAVWGRVRDADGDTGPHWWLVLADGTVIDPLGEDWRYPAVEYHPRVDPADDQLDRAWAEMVEGDKAGRLR
ncbi:hypothetical protein AZL_013830 [Azospirillum sp. B510]|uniref:hypothetical protein n=1 Tax=Azospirillum sp. (strain B510) TaxID=137722 RepID=UPI0001C4C382|nr:hypothetical protein [Azospirillum sp. B510]BAI72021.1 hypothetical protein AZL_013830 [Azospirillum sp. B510]